MSSCGFIHYPPIEKHGVIGDRRTAALVAADGTIDWFCAPDYDGCVVFGAILDADNGGFCRFGPENPDLGTQHCEKSTICLTTKWMMPESGLGEIPDKWVDTRRTIHFEVLAKGWCEERRAFRQRYDSDALDAATLLIPLMGFLPSDDPRVTATIKAIENELMIDGLVYRFDPSATLGGEQLAIYEIPISGCSRQLWLF